MAVTPERELWMLGSIENFTVNVFGAATEIGDTDAYNIEVNPCHTYVANGMIMHNKPARVQEMPPMPPDPDP